MTVTASFQITGMSCGHCESAVRTEVGRLAGIEVVDVSAATGRLVIRGTGAVDDGQVIDAVDEAGYVAVRV